MNRIWIFAAALLMGSTAVWAQEVSPASIAGQMKTHGLSESIGCVTPTLCELCGVPKPDICEAGPLEPVLQLGKERFGECKAEKVLIFCPDAVGKVQCEHWPDDLTEVMAGADYRMTGTNVLPSVTPVCFATVFTGASPSVHGIQEYIRPVLKVQTLFDIFVAAGKKVAIVAQNEVSIDLIFRQRNISYFSFPCAEDMYQFTKLLLKNDDYDVIVCHDGSYDLTMHANGVWSNAAHKALQDVVRRYLDLIVLTDDVWAGYNRVTAFTPDHGAHDIGPNHGEHGTDSPEDSIVYHLWRVRAAEK